MNGPGATGDSFVETTFGPVVKCTALLVAGGYMSLRTHLNHMGISGPAFLGAERYLMEAYLFVVGMFEVLIWLALPLLVIPSAAPLLRRVGPPGPSRAIRHLGAIVGTLRPLSALMFLSILIALLLAAATTTDLLVGDLRDRFIPERRPYLFRIAMIGATLWCVLLVAERRRSTESASLFGNTVSAPIGHALAMAITLGYALAVPLMYGRELHPTTYPMARVFLQESTAAPLCGFVVLHWSNGIMLWQAVGGRGRLTSLALDRTAAIEWGPARDILHALAVARLPGHVPDCAADFPST